jgi:hypothetical protein
MAKTGRKPKAQTKEAIFLQRVERLIGMKEGPRAERVRAALRLGLATPAAHRERRDTPLAAGLHSMTIAMISLYDQDRAVVKDLGGRKEPEFDVAALAQALLHLSTVVDAVNVELDLAEAGREAA